jgi:hypothetical protein
VSPLGLSRALAAWALGCAVLCAVVHRAFSLREDRAHPRAVIVSLWEKGELFGRAVMARVGDSDTGIQASRVAHPAGTLVYETVIAEGPVIAWADAALALSFVGGRDGVSATFEGRTEYITPDDLLVRQAYDKQMALPSIGLSAGLDLPVMWAILSERFSVSVHDLVERARIRRIRVVRSIQGEPLERAVTADALTDQDARQAAIAAGRFLARGVDDDGRFRYLIDAPTNRTLAGYDLPRHAGATYYLAQVAGQSGDRQLGMAALRAAGWMREHAMVACGTARCIGSDRVVDVGSTALAVLAFVEIARTKLDPAFATLVTGLTEFLRAQQRANGDFMHEYNRDTQRPIDVQLVYYTGEASLALSRAHGLLGDPRDLEAASRALAYLVGPGWTFFGSRYYYGEEHWTCQAMDDLWDQAPNLEALDFCLRWHAFGRRLQYAANDTPYDAEGAYGFGPLVAPHLTPAASRSEAAVATLEAARKAGVAARVLAPLEMQIRKSLAMLIRHQFRPGPRHLLANPTAVNGAIPGSEVDWQLRIDFAQHAGSALLRWQGLGPSTPHAEGLSSP